MCGLMTVEEVKEVWRDIAFDAPFSLASTLTIKREDIEIIEWSSNVHKCESL